MKNNKNLSKGINRKSFERTRRKGTRRKGTRRKGTRREGMISKRTRRGSSRLKKYSKRKNLKKSNTKKRQKYSKMKGGVVLTKEKITFDGGVTLWEKRGSDSDPGLTTPKGGATYQAVENMIIEGKGEKKGEGGYGVVRKFTAVEKVLFRRPVAVKIIKMTSETSKPRAENEYHHQKILGNLYDQKTKKHSRYFAKVHNFFQPEDNFCGIVVELLGPKFEQNLELEKLIAKNFLNDINLVHYSLELARAISATHKMGIVHGDLKPENIAIARDGSEMGQLKLMDFGLSFMAGDGGGNKIDCCNMLAIGTPWYFSYEVLSLYIQPNMKRTTPKKTWGAASDWWSYGIVVYEMVVGKCNSDNYPSLVWASTKDPSSDTMSINDTDTLTQVESMQRSWDGDEIMLDTEKINLLQSQKEFSESSAVGKLLLELAFQFFVKNPKERPFLCLDDPQKEDYGGTIEGERAKALQRIVAELEINEAIQLELAHTKSFERASRVDKINQKIDKFTKCYGLPDDPDKTKFIPPSWSTTKALEYITKCKVYYDHREDVKDIKRLVREREPVNMASFYPAINPRQYDPDLLESHFGYREAYYGVCPISNIPGSLCPPNILVYTPTATTLSENYGVPNEFQEIHVLNAYGLAFDADYQRDYKAFSGLSEDECVNKAKEFYGHLFTNIFKVAKKLKMGTIVMSLVGGGFFAEGWLSWLNLGYTRGQARKNLLEGVWIPTFQSVMSQNTDIKVLFMGSGLDTKRFFNVEDIGFFPREVIPYLRGKTKTWFWGEERPNILSTTLLINAWDCWSSPGNGNRGDRSLDGYIGRNTCVTYLGTGVTNPHLERNLVPL